MSEVRGRNDVYVRPSLPDCVVVVVVDRLPSVFSLQLVFDTQIFSLVWELSLFLYFG